MSKFLKFFLIGLSCLILATPVFAEDGAGVGKISLHISDPAQRNTYFVCIADFGCFSLLASEAHKSFPTMTGSINAMFTTNVFTRRMYPQAIPASCHVRLRNKQTLNVYGSLDVTRSDVRIDNLHCTVS